jgi:CDP-glucose 4,6-dehydratase
MREIINLMFYYQYGAKMNSGFWKNKRVAVTGASGFIGAAICNELHLQGAKVCALARRTDAEIFKVRGLNGKIAVKKCDVNEIKSIEKCLSESRAEYVFNLAATTSMGYAFNNPLEAMQTNVMGTGNVLEVCRKRGIKIVHASSTKAYGEQKKKVLDDNAPLESKLTYGLSKGLADRIAMNYFENYGLQGAIIRVTNAYGPYDLGQRLIPNTIRSVMHGEKITVYGDGLAKRDWVYIDDIVDAYLRVAEKSSEKKICGQAFNIGIGKNMTINQTVKKIAELMGAKNTGIEHRQRTFPEEMESNVSAQKAHKLLGWKASHGFEKGLQETIEWYRRYFAGH